VIEVSKRYLPQMAIGYSSSKVKVHIQDGMEFMAQCQGQFDVIITDSSDPIGESLREPEGVSWCLGFEYYRE